MPRILERLRDSFGALGRLKEIIHFRKFITQINRKSSERTETNSAIDFDEEIKYPRITMKIIGIWPFAYRGKQTIHCITVPVLTLLVLLTTKSYTIEWRNDGTYQLLITIFIELVTVKVFICKIFEQDIQEIFAFMEDDWNRSKYFTIERKNIMANNAKQSQIISKVLGILVAAGTTSAVNLPWVASHILQESVQFYADIWYPFTISPISGLIMILEFLTILYTSMAFLCLETYFIIVAKHCCAQLKILSSTIEQYNGRILHNIPTEQYDCACTECIVMRHVEIIEFFKSIKKLFHPLISTNLVLGQMYILAAVVTSFKQSGSGSTFFLIICWMSGSLSILTKLLYCNIGEELRQESLNVGDAVFNCQWHELEGIDAKSSLMTMIVSQSMPMVIMAGGIFPVSHELFKDCVFSVLSVFSLFRTIYQKNNRSSAIET
ncbi:uncharacterized protein LOC107046523 [Diachasma alloeum]|uniref:uncharacterized protein LOC107046523 n=1 Tax=Diachasma alloeum TaxID=454923 RepID=UPI000738225C|nr:uncharacterized protein LOC107046523 [Diachasma alloeum]